MASLHHHRTSKRWMSTLLLLLAWATAISTNGVAAQPPQLQPQQAINSSLLPDASRVRSISLSMGCPDFLSSFYEANVSSTTPYRYFSITKGAGYGYVALHFAKLWMPTGSSIILRAAEGFTTQDVLFNLSVAFPSGELHENVMAPPLLAKELRVEFYRHVGAATATNDTTATSSPSRLHLGSSRPTTTSHGSSTTTTASATSDGPDRVNDRHCYGFVVDWYYYVLVDGDRNITPSNELTCANDNSKEAICYYEDGATRNAYLASRAVARLLIQKQNGQTAACTGWLLGSQGHVITNHHCVNTQKQASATTVEFMADAPVCTQSCMSWGGCPGTVEAISTVLVRANEDLDYALLKLETNVNLPIKYGFLRFKATLGRVGQEIYIPQHPLYYGKRIAMVNDYGTKTTISGTDIAGCGRPGYAYNGDTQGGSSGSPVLDARDHGVVALHHCGQFCANTGIPADQIIADLQANGVLPASAVDPGDDQNIANFPLFTPQAPVVPRTLAPQRTINGAIQQTANGDGNGNGNGNGKNNQVTIDQFEFTLANDAEISVDVLSAEVSDDGTFTDLNGDCQASYMDAIIFLFRKGDPTVVAVADDDTKGAGTGDGSVSSRDPYMQTFLKSGTYILSVAAMPATSSDAYNGVSRQADAPELYSCVTKSQSGSYRVQFQSSDAMAFNRVPQAVAIPGTCDVPAGTICSF